MEPINMKKVSLEDLILWSAILSRMVSALHPVENMYLSETIVSEQVSGVVVPKNLFIYSAVDKGGCAFAMISCVFFYHFMPLR